MLNCQFLLWLPFTALFLGFFFQFLKNFALVSVSYQIMWHHFNASSSDNRKDVKMLFYL